MPPGPWASPAAPEPVDAKLVGGGVDRGLGPAVEHRILADRQRQAAAQLLERTRLSSMRLNWLAAARRASPARAAAPAPAPRAIAAAPIQSSGDKVSP